MDCIGGLAVVTFNVFIVIVNNNGHFNFFDLKKQVAITPQ